MYFFTLHRLWAELGTLARNGFTWMNGNIQITSTVDLLMASVDTPAHAMVQNFVQFNGTYGCSWCETSGARVKKGKGNVQTYPNEPQPSKKRTYKRVKRHAAYAIETESPHIGVKGWSPFYNIYDFDVVEGCVYDAMHDVDLGVSRQLASLWFDSKNSTSAWYIGTPTEIARIDSRIAKIIPPSNVTRLPRSLNQRAYWKAAEWRNFLLYYAPIVLKDILPNRFHRHFVKLSEAIFSLNNNYISPMDLYLARKKIENFVEEFENLYGKEHMSFNVHILLHACDCVSRWEPLWAYSAYGFEDSNGRLGKLFNGTQSVDLQVASKFIKIQNLKAKGIHLITDSENEVINNLVQILLGDIPKLKRQVTMNNCSFFGSGKKV
jgi:hypothetical protein